MRIAKVMGFGPLGERDQRLTFHPNISFRGPQGAHVIAPAQAPAPGQDAELSWTDLAVQDMGTGTARVWARVHPGATGGSRRRRWVA